MDRKILLLHEGMPKCGTSTIQLASQQYNSLIQQNGYLYPDLSLLRSLYPDNVHVSSGNCNDLVYALYGLSGQYKLPHEFDLLGITDQILKLFTTQNASSIVLSHEDLITIPENGLSVVINKCRAEGVLVRSIFYVREQSEWLASDYQQRIKQLRIGEDIGTHVAAKLLSCKYSQHCGKWARLVGRENMIVRLLHPRSIDTNLVFDFYKSIGAQIAELRGVEIKTANESLDAFSIQVLNSAFKRNLPEEIQRELLITATKMTARRARSKFRLPPELHDFVRKYYQEDNQRMREYLSLDDWRILAEVASTPASQSDIDLRDVHEEIIDFLLLHRGVVRQSAD